MSIKLWLILQRNCTLALFNNSSKISCRFNFWPRVHQRRTFATVGVPPLKASRWIITERAFSSRSPKLLQNQNETTPNIILVGVIMSTFGVLYSRKNVLHASGPFFSNNTTEKIIKKIGPDTPIYFLGVPPSTNQQLNQLKHDANARLTAAFEQKFALDKKHNQMCNLDRLVKISADTFTDTKGPFTDLFEETRVTTEDIRQRYKEHVIQFSRIMKLAKELDRDLTLMVQNHEKLRLDPENRGLTSTLVQSTAMDLIQIASDIVATTDKAIQNMSNMSALIDDTLPKLQTLYNES